MAVKLSVASSDPLKLGLDLISLSVLRDKNQSLENISSRQSQLFCHFSSELSAMREGTMTNSPKINLNVWGCGVWDVFPG